MDQFLGNYSYSQIMAKSDKRLENWPLMQSPLSTITLCCLYVYIVKYFGPQYMKNREPFNVKKLMIVYNFLMIIISILLVYFYGKHGWLNNYSYKCQPVDYSNSYHALGMAKTCYFYYIVKYLEFIDTFFFVLRKKYNQITTLHVIHHGVMPFSVWWGLKFVPGGHATFFSFINSFIHVIMYTYYGLSAFGPHMAKYLWWKKYLTSLQIIQMMLIFTHCFQLMFRECNFPKVFIVWIGCHGILFLFLFSEFYKKTYLKSVQYFKSTSKTQQIKQVIEKRLN